MGFEKVTHVNTVAYVRLCYSFIHLIQATMAHMTDKIKDTGLQPDCLHGLLTTLRYVLVLPLSSFS